MSAAAKEQNQSFDGVAPGVGARLSTQEVWQSISDMAGQVRALATLHTSLHNALFATLASPVMGPAPQAAKLTRELQAKIDDDDDLKVAVQDEVSEDKWSAAREAIIGFVHEHHTEVIKSILSNIDNHINENTSTNTLKSLLNENNKILSTLSPTLEALVKHREEEVFHSSDTARNSLEKICEETRARFRAATVSNATHFGEIEKATKLKKEIKTRRDTLSDDLTIKALD